jgi:hypothetical protein
MNDMPDSQQALDDGADNDVDPPMSDEMYQILFDINHGEGD